MAGNHFVASIDIGTEKISLLVAEKDDDHLRIIGHNVCPSKGVRRGFVKELEKELNKFLYLDKEEALAAGNERQELIKSIEITPINDYEGIKI